VSSTSSSGPAGALGLSLPRVYLAVHGRNFLRNPTFSKVRYNLLGSELPGKLLLATSLITSVMKNRKTGCQHCC
jgi:hypothetical protein